MDTAFPRPASAGGKEGGAMGTTPTKGAPRGAQLVHRLDLLVDGLKKHGGDPGLPVLFAVNDFTVIRDRLTEAMVEKSAATARERLQRQKTAAQAQTARALYQQGVAAIEGFYGLESPTLGEFGVAPRKGPGSPAARGARKTKHARRVKQQPSAQPSPAAVPTAPEPSPAPAMAASPSLAAPPLPSPTDTVATSTETGGAP
jgi:hypothetical protein